MKNYSNFTVFLLGDNNVGKSQIVNRYRNDSFAVSYKQDSYLDISNEELKARSI
jgi:GTPase SAR1 family protein